MFKPSLEVYEDKGLILMIHFQKEGEKVIWNCIVN